MVKSGWRPFIKPGMSSNLLCDTGLRGSCIGRFTVGSSFGRTCDYKMDTSSLVMCEMIL